MTATASPRYPQMVLLKKTDGTGFGFTFLSNADFTHAAGLFLGPVIKDMAARGQAPTGPDDRRLEAAAHDVLVSMFGGTLDPGQAIETVRWLAAAFVREYYRLNGEPPPQVVVVERLAGDVAARSGAEYLAHPGHPLAVVVGHPNEGGGPCHFFDTPEDYRQAGTGAPTDSCWLPQILYRLYAATPSVMMGRPRAQDEGASVGVECNGVTFGRPAPLVERAQVGG